MVIDATDRFPGATARHLNVEGLAEQYGDQARAALESYKGRLDLKDRERMAANFAQIIERFSIKPRHLKYSSEASSDSGLRRDLSRLSSSKPEDTPASSLKWGQYLHLVANALAIRGESVSEDWLYHRLTLGTGFHPKAFASSDPEELVVGYETLTMDIDSDFRLLDSYRRIAELLVIEEQSEWTIEQRESLAETIPAFSILDKALEEYISEDIRAEFGLEKGSFVSSSRDQQDAILQLVEQYDAQARSEAEESGQVYLPMSTLALRRYLHAVEPDLVFSEFEPVQSCLRPAFANEYELDWLPHALLGWGSLFGDIEMPGVEEVRNHTDINNVLCRKENEDWGAYVGYVYLVLYPAADTSRLIPILVFKGDDFSEVSMAHPLTVDILTLSEGRYIPANLNGIATTESWSSLFDLLLDTRRIRDSLKATAGNIEQHPSLKAQTEAVATRKASIDLLFDYDGAPESADTPPLD